jgi:hypothetical protein
MRAAEFYSLIWSIPVYVRPGVGKTASEIIEFQTVKGEIINNRDSLERTVEDHGRVLPARQAHFRAPGCGSQVSSGGTGTGTGRDPDPRNMLYHI